MVQDVGDPEQVNDKKKRWQLEKEQQEHEFRAVASTPEGRAVLWRILELCGLYSSSFTGDVYHAFLAEGRRDVGLKILRLFGELKDEGDSLMFRMMREAKTRQRKGENNV